MIPSLFHILTKLCAYRRGRVKGRELVKECRRFRSSSPVSSRYSGRNNPASYFINAYIYMTNTVFNRCLRYVSLFRIYILYYLAEDQLKCPGAGYNRQPVKTGAYRENGVTFTIKNEIEAECLSCRQSTGIVAVVKCISGSNLIILALKGDKLSCGQALNGERFNFQVKFDLEVQGPASLKIFGFLAKAFCTSVPNLVVIGWTADELSCRQASDW